MKKLNVGCGTHYAQGWTNTDVVYLDHTKPDVVVAPGEKYPFEDDFFDLIFLGHVLEHMDYIDVFKFVFDMKRILKSSGQMLVTGPDVLRTLKRWRQGAESDELMYSVIEHQDYYPEDPWPGASHHWNCDEGRTRRILEYCGLQVESYSDRVQGSSWKDSKTKIVWPVVGYAKWQFALMATK